MTSSTALERKSLATLSIRCASSRVAFAAARSLISALTSPSTCDFTDSCCAARRASSTANLSSAIYLPQMEKHTRHSWGARRGTAKTLFWRRGWDSNPRNGFPFTAFPVLPVQPLLHLSPAYNAKLSRGISNLTLRTLKSEFEAGGEGGIRTHGGR